MPGGFADILKGIDRERERKFGAKLPQWAAADAALPSGDHMEIPSSLNLEQCSSTAAALYKASLAFSLCHSAHFRIADLTGGLGVDSWAFSKVAQSVFYNEMDHGLAMASERNFHRLGCTGIGTHCFEVSAGSTDGWRDAVGNFAPDIIYLDPARRSSSGRKVFLLEDCSPDVFALLPDLFALCPCVIVKLSPMADIAMLRERFGTCLSQIHIVSLDGEVRELLAVLRGAGAVFEGVKVAVLRPDGQADILPFGIDDEHDAPVHYPVSGMQYRYMFEPGAALLKAGVFRTLCSRFDLVKMAPSTHLYFCTDTNSELAPFGRFFAVREMRGFDNAAVRDVASRHLRAEVVARNVPITSDRLRERMSVLPGNGLGYIFGTSVLDGDSVRRVLIFADRI